MISNLLVALSLLVTVEATQVSLLKVDKKIYVETDSQHFALFRVTKEARNQIAVVNDQTHKRLIGSDCEPRRNDIIDWHKLNLEISVYFEDYKAFKDDLLKKVEKSPESAKSYRWSDSLSETADERPFAFTSLPDGSSVYSSKYFPSDLARVIFSKDLVIFVRYDGKVSIKLIECSYRNEKILIEGIKKINTEGKKFWMLPNSKPDKALQKHLKANPISRAGLSLENEFMKTYTKEESAAMMRAIRNQVTIESDYIGRNTVFRNY